MPTFMVVGIVVAMALMAAIAILLFTSIRRRDAGLIDRWAAENGYRIVGERGGLHLFKTFQWWTWRFQHGYRITVEDREGNVRRGWLRCVDFSRGMAQDKVTVKWDE